MTPLGAGIRIYTLKFAQYFREIHLVEPRHRACYERCLEEDIMKPMRVQERVVTAKETAYDPADWMPAITAGFIAFLFVVRVLVNLLFH